MMILRRIARPRAIAKSLEQLAQQQHRTLPPSISQYARYAHTVPPLGNTSNDLGKVFGEHGVPGFLSPRTYHQNWEQYQKQLCEQLDVYTEGTSNPNESAWSIHTRTSKQPEYAHIYNVAAMTFFNHFWWESLSAEKTEPSPGGSLIKDIEEYFGSLNELRTEMCEHADAMFGNGFVWLMKEVSTGSYGSMHTGGRLRLLCTYNAGSPFIDAYRMRQSTDMMTGANIAEDRRNMRSRGNNSNNSMLTPQNRVGSFGPHSISGRDGTNTSHQLRAVPILCVNVWQHMWIPDYGILGKQTYLGAWWERINWTVVESRWKNAPKAQGSGQR